MYAAQVYLATFEPPMVSDREQFRELTELGRGTSLVDPVTCNDSIEPIIQAPPNGHKVRGLPMAAWH